jgi:hypothetical protein
MRIAVVTDENGTVLGSAPLPTAEGEPEVRLVAGPGQVLHEMDLPAGVDEMRSVEELHEALQGRLAER